ncbi:TetR family transcriptional regulator [Nocardia tenerifensis]|uniref:TetR family transcriptional regulator n=1 Tax=Nocardia tenerifensis TaxID=228006 RepID=A0A318JWR4_9NOCA|nr:TetR/AcrR family transcriptional regulator [Nocardia tenerifensis]PXX61059.1 TetR family transcriptional regulator [Nocardia tenerifensis]
MGNREDLLAGARKAVLERGLAKTTARDIAGAAGVSLAAIGYHFGSKDRLVTEAIAESIGSGVGDGMDAAIRTGGTDRSLRESAAPTWDSLLEVVANNHETLLLSAENGLLVARSPESQQYMAEATETALHELTQTLLEVHPELPVERARAVVSLYFLLFQGLAMTKLIAPAAATMDGEQLALAVETLRDM